MQSGSKINTAWHSWLPLKILTPRRKTANFCILMCVLNYSINTERVSRAENTADAAVWWWILRATLRTRSAGVRFTESRKPRFANFFICHAKYSPAHTACAPKHQRTLGMYSERLVNLGLSLERAFSSCEKVFPHQQTVCLFSRKGKNKQRKGAVLSVCLQERLWPLTWSRPQLKETWH